MLERVTGYPPSPPRSSASTWGVVARARGATHEFAAESIDRTLYFGCESGLSAPGAGVEFARLVACAPPDHSAARFVHYQPARDGGYSLVAAALTAQFFESVFADEDRQTGRPDLPLVGYAGNEAYRYVTSTAMHAPPGARRRRKRRRRPRRSGSAREAGRQRKRR